MTADRERLRRNRETGETTEKQHWKKWMTEKEYNVGYRKRLS